MPQKTVATVPLSAWTVTTLVVMLRALGCVLAYRGRRRPEVIASVVLSAISLAKGEPQTFVVSEVSAASIGGFLYLVIVGSIGFPLFFWLLEVTSPAKVATEAYVCPVIALVLGTVIAGEPFTVWTGVAAVIIVAGVAMLISDRGRRADVAVGIEPVGESRDLGAGAHAMVEVPRSRPL